MIKTIAGILGSIGSVIDGYSPENINQGMGMQSNGVDSYLGLSQCMTLITSRPLSKARFYLYREGNSVGNVVAKIYNTSGIIGSTAIPTGSPLAQSLPISRSIINTYSSTPAPFAFIFDTHPVISGDIAVSVEWDGTGSWNDNVVVQCDDSTQTHLGNMAQKHNGAWTPISTIDLAFYLFTI